MPEISIVVPMYNAEKTLSKCIDSILNQTQSNIEIILVDDGSIDDTANICLEYANKFENIFYYHQSNRGVSAARNLGITHASGSFIGFIDSDDYIRPDMYEKMIEVLRQSDSDICVAGYCIVSQENTIVKIHDYPQILDRKNILYRYIPELIGGTSGTATIGSSTICLYRASLIKNIAFPESIKLLEDTIFNIECLMEANKICFVSEPLYYYCVCEQSATNKYRKDALSQILLVTEKLRKIVLYLGETGMQIMPNYYCRVKGFYLYLIKNEAKKKDDTGESLPRRIKHISDILIFREMFCNYRPSGIKEKILFFMVRLKMYHLIARLL